MIGLELGLSSSYLHMTVLLIVAVPEAPLGGDIDLDDELSTA